MDVNYYLDNWEKFWQSYAKLNPDLAMAGIKGKRSLKNHYVSCGIKENRKVIETEITYVDKPTIYEEKPKTFILTEIIFKEKLY